jgi:hypothetical protein
MQYSVFIKDTINNVLWEIPYQSFSFTEEINRGKDARFTFEYEALRDLTETYNTTYITVLGGGFREIWVEKNGAKIYYGVITDIDEASDRETEQVTVSVASVGFFNILGKRRTNNKRIFSSTDAGNIAWTLINESQSNDSPYSNLGIAQGTIDTSISRDRTFRFDNIKEAITKLSNDNLSNGFDCEVDNEKLFHARYPQQGTNRMDMIFDEGNILNWSRNRPSVLSLTNKVYVIGEGVNDDVLYSTRTSSSEYRQVFGTLEEVLSERDIKDSTTLNAKGDRFLLDNQSPLETITISHVDGNPSIADYHIGDTIRLTIPKLGIASQSKRVSKRTIACDGNDLAIVTLTLR